MHKIILKEDEIPVEGALGLLAYGDVAFLAWRNVKKKYNKEKENEKK